MAFYQGYQFQQPYVYQQMQQPVQQTQTTPQIQNGGFVSVRSEADARNYPVAPGNSVTFKDENAPYIYTKTMGFSQLDRPIFKKFKLVEEDSEEQQASNEIDSVRSDIKKIWSEINALKRKPTKPDKNGES